MRSRKGYSCFAKPAESVKIRLRPLKQLPTKNIILAIIYSANEGLEIHRTNASGQLDFKIIKALLSEDYSEEL